MTRHKPTLAVPIAPEDIRRGFYVAVLHVIDQYPSYCFGLPGRTELLVSVRSLPEGDTEPLEVIDVCLPFVTVRKADRGIVTLDVRRHELARLDDAYARRVVKRLRPRRSRDRDQTS